MSKTFILLLFLPSFDCSSFKNRDATKCHYNNESFSIGEEVHNDDIESTCTIGCYCRGHDAEAKFECTHIDCPEFFGGPSTEVRGKKCIRQYKPKGCCLSNTVCGKKVLKVVEPAFFS